MEKTFNPEQEHMFQEAFADLKENIQPNEFTDKLYQEGVLTYDEKREIDETQSIVKRKEVFFDAVHKYKYKGSLSVFWNVLENKYQLLYKSLKQDHDDRSKTQGTNQRCESTSSEFNTYEIETESRLTLSLSNMERGLNVKRLMARKSQLKFQICVTRMEAAVHFMLEILNFARLSTFEKIRIELELYFRFKEKLVFAGSDRMQSDNKRDRLTISLPYDSQLINDVGKSEVETKWIVRTFSNTYFGIGQNPVANSSSSAKEKTEKTLVASSKCEHALVCSKCGTSFPNHDFKETEKVVNIKTKRPGSTLREQKAYAKATTREEKSLQDRYLFVPTQRLSPLQDSNSSGVGNNRSSMAFHARNMAMVKKRTLPPIGKGFQELSLGPVSPKSNSRSFGLEITPINLNVQNLEYVRALSASRSHARIPRLLERRENLEITPINLNAQSFENCGVLRAGRSNTSIPQLLARIRRTDLMLPLPPSQQPSLFAPSMRGRVLRSSTAMSKIKNQTRSQSSCD